jgi:imidazolonepropionase-like amidohydrolase
VALAAVYSQRAETQGSRSTAVALYEGARLIVGDGSAPVENAAFLVENGTITKVGKKGEVTAPAGATRVDLTGKTVMPTLINAHGHPGFTRGLTYSKDNYTRETLLLDLNRLLYFGIGAIQSQGLEIGTVLDGIRADQETGRAGGARVRIAGRGIASPNTGPGGVVAGIAYEITTEDQARQAVQELTARKVDLIKIWVDDRRGRAPKLAPNLCRLIIDEAHRSGIRVNAHLFYHEDAVYLVNAGLDGLAHLVRDREMGDALVASIVQRNVYVMPTLNGNEQVKEVPPWLKDGAPLLRLMQESVPAPVIERIKKAYQNPDPNVSPRAPYALVQRNTAKLARANAKIILGADNGLADTLLGVTEHRELDSMVKAGMTPMQVIVAATSRAAEYLKLDKMGTIAPGKEADFLVLDANPLDEITNTQRISRVYFKGAQVDRAAMRIALGGPPSN